MQITLLPKELIELQRELFHPDHTEFNRQLNQSPRPFDEVLTDLCTALGVVVEGMYSPADQLALAKKCTMILERRRINAIANVTLTKH